MEAQLLDQAWGMWDSEEASGGEDQSQAPQMLEDHDDIRSQVKAAIDQHHREWEPPSHPLVQNDPQLLPDGGLTPQIGGDFFLDERFQGTPRGKDMSQGQIPPCCGKNLPRRMCLRLKA